MAPLSQAVGTHFVYETGDGTRVYKGKIDPEWTVASVPHGGYILSSILSALLSHQRQNVRPGHPLHPDPAHLVAHYLRASSLDDFEVQIRVLKTGKGFTNLGAEFWQAGILRVVTHSIFTELAPFPYPLPLESSEPPTPNSDSTKKSYPSRPITYIPPSPMASHPSSAKIIPMYPTFNFKHRVTWTEPEQEDEVSGNADGTLKWRAYFELSEEHERIGAAMIPFFADMFRNGPEMLREDQRPGPSWFPTMVLSLEFKAKLDFASASTLDEKRQEYLITNFSPRTVGLYSHTRTVHEGRHDNVVEVWTAPTTIGDTGSKDTDWRQKQYCLAVASQMALVVPLEVNERKGKKGADSDKSKAKL